MTKKDNFYTLYIEYKRVGERKEISLVDCTQRLKGLFDVWTGMRKNARLATERTMDAAISRFFGLLSHLSDWERKEEFEKLKKEMPDMDDFFVRIDKKFPRWVILSKLSRYGYIRPQN